VNPRFIDWIWHVRGSLALAPEQSSDDAFERLDPLFREAGTSHERTGDTLTFQKKDQAAQNKISVFDNGVLQIEKGVAGPVLRYDLASRALLFCFLVPLLFLGIAQFTLAVVKLEKQSAEAESASEKAAEAAKKEAAKKAVVPMNALDKALGAPAPEPKKPKEDDADNPDGEGKKPSPTPAYVLAAIFALLYVVGRVLEDRLILGLFKKKLQGA
jgi:hypothetical protein